MFKRSFDLHKQLNRKTFFFFGPRQTGKSTYLREHFPEALFINLLKSAEFRELLSRPEVLRERVDYFLKNTTAAPVVILDEVQKVPQLLDEVHDLIESNKELRFIMAGSSPRKLKRLHANMLGGRAGLFKIHPITYGELKTDPKHAQRSWKELLLHGSLPSILNSSAPWEDLEDYISIYLKEEIEEEGLSRSLGGFSRFLNFAALRLSDQLNFTSLASDAQLSPITVKEYFSILHDTLVGHLVPSFNQTKKRKAMTSAKFYFFDLGVANALVKRKSLVEHSSEWGALLENFIHNEIQAFLDYHRIKKTIQFWRSTSKLEVDFVIWDESNEADLLAIEVKSTSNPSNKCFSGLRALAEEFPKMKKILVCQTQAPALTQDGVEVLHVEAFLEKLWKGEIIG